MGEIRKDIPAMVEEMPAFPQSVHRVIQLTSDINSDPRDLVDAIQHDPILMMRILKLVNSSYFGLDQKISSINHAIVYIGVNTVKNLALSAAVIGVMPSTNAAGFDMDGFLRHSLSTAIIARILARKAGVRERDVFDFFLSGLLHDFGKIVLAHFLPHEFNKALTMASEEGIHLYEAEQIVFTADHTQVGSLLGEKWRLPLPLVACLREHHGHNRESSLIMAAVSAANQIGKELKLGYSGENIIEKLPQTISDLFDTAEGAVINSLGDVGAEMEKAMIFIKN
ncbi:MAG: HDOD domain-containing protein [Syntrophales bacterium]